MLNGYGWVLLRARTPADARARQPDPDLRDAESDDADVRLWAAFRAWMVANDDPYLRWDLVDRNNNDRGVLTFSVSQNHRTGTVWDMLAWIATNGPGSYGLVHVHDDESPTDNNTFRVHRLTAGYLEDLPDPFFGPLRPAQED